MKISMFMKTASILHISGSPGIEIRDRGIHYSLFLVNQELTLPVYGLSLLKCTIVQLAFLFFWILKTS